MRLTGRSSRYASPVSVALRTCTYIASKLEPPRLQPYNLVQGGRRYCKSPASFCPNLESPVCRKKGDFTPDEDLYPVSIVPFNKLANLDVHCFGRTSGLKGGRVGAAMSFVKIYGRTTFSQSWTVIGEFGGKQSSVGDHLPLHIC